MPYGAPDPADFQEAIDIWTKFGETRFSDRKSVVFNKHWRKSPCTLLAYAADRACRFPDHLHEKFGELLKYNEHSSSVFGLFSLTLADALQKDRDSLAERLRCQIQCLIHAVQAGCAWQAYVDSSEEHRTDRQNEFNAAVLKVIGFYARAYPLTDDCLTENETLWAFVDDDAGQAVRRSVLDAARTGVRAGQLVSVSGYLAAQRLLEYLVGERAGRDQTGREQPDTRDTFVKIPSRISSADSNSSSGGAFDVFFRRSTEAVCGVFLDPVAVGLTPIDDDVFASLRAAWNEQRLPTELAKPQDHLPTVRAISICPKFTFPVSLSGESAGLAFAVGMCAEARQVKLDPKTTASARLDPKNPGRILDVAKASLKDKFAAAKAAGIERIILEAEQAKRFGTHEDAKGLTLIGVSTLAEAWHQWTKKTPTNSGWKRS
jgi:hypothetical protein